MHGYFLNILLLCMSIIIISIILIIITFLVNNNNYYNLITVTHWIENSEIVSEDQFTMCFLLQSVKNADKAGVMEALKSITATITRLIAVLLQINGKDNYSWNNIITGANVYWLKL